jgi:hypothetical protein
MKTKKCQGPAGPYCVALDERLNANPGGYGVAGISSFVVTHVGTGARRTVGVVHRLTKKDAGLMLNHCPWCGGNIEPEEKKAGAR